MEKSSINTACYKISKIKPDAVIYIYSGGFQLGNELSNRLEIPLISLDVRYPLTRFMKRFSALAPICWPIKEVVYRLTTPRPGVADRRTPLYESLPENSKRVVLADDRISTGRTLDVALGILESAGIPRDSITVVTRRCNQKNSYRVNYVIQR